MNDRFKFIRDIGLKYIGKSKKQRYMFSLFECPFCRNQIESRKTVGMKQVCCKKCYKDYRKGKHYGSIVEKVFRFNKRNEVSWFSSELRTLEGNQL